jgi:hypothetical protein
VARAAEDDIAWRVPQEMTSRAAGDAATSAGPPQILSAVFILYICQFRQFLTDKAFED